MVGALVTRTTMWVFLREPFLLPFHSPSILTPCHTVTADCWSMRMIVCFVFHTANVPTKREWMTTCHVWRLGKLIMDLSSIGLHALTASFIPLNRHSPSVMVRLYLGSKLSSILVYISSLPGLLIPIMFLLITFLFLRSQAALYESSQVPIMAKPFSLCYPFKLRLLTNH